MLFSLLRALPFLARSVLAFSPLGGRNKIEETLYLRAFPSQILSRAIPGLICLSRFFLPPSRHRLCSSRASLSSVIRAELFSRRDCLLALLTVVNHVELLPLFFLLGQGHDSGQSHFPLSPLGGAVLLSCLFFLSRILLLLSFCLVPTVTRCLAVTASSFLALSSVSTPSVLSCLFPGFSLSPAPPSRVSRLLVLLRLAFIFFFLHLSLLLWLNHSPHSANTR